MQSCNDVVSLESIGCVKSPSTDCNFAAVSENEGTVSLVEGALLATEFAQGLVSIGSVAGTGEAGDVRCNDDVNGRVAVVYWVSALPCTGAI